MRLRAALLAAAAVTVSSAAHAQEQQQQQPQQHEPSPKRALPNYDGRGLENPDDPALWPLRIVLSPLYLIEEYVLRRPIGWMTIQGEKRHVPERLYDFFAFGPDHKIGFVPVGFVEFGFNPSIGIWGFWDDALWKNNHLRMHYEMWPDEWYAGNVTDRWDISKSNVLTVRAQAFTRPDQVFYGLGPESAQYHQSRYTEHNFDAFAMLQTYVWRSSHFDLQGGVRKVDLSPGHFGSDPSLEVEARTGAFAIPFGFDRGYLAPYGRVRGTLDSRPRETATSGVRIDVQAEGGGDVEHSPSSGWVRWGGAASAYVDLSEGYSRILSFTVVTAFSDPIGDNPVPFTELVMLGGDNWMHGFFPGRLIDRSGIVGQLQYKWPVAPWLNGTLQTAVGNVFGPHLDGFDPKLLRVSAGVGFSMTAGELPFEALLGFGTDTIDRGAKIDSVRVSFGVPRLF